MSNRVRERPLSRRSLWPAPTSTFSSMGTSLFKRRSQLLCVWTHVDTCVRLRYGEPALIASHVVRHAGFLAGAGIVKISLQQLIRPTRYPQFTGKHFY